MRRAFVEQLLDLAQRDPSVVLLTGDLGFSVLEPFAERFDDRFFNLGVAEQNMLGVATGLAAAGMRPFAYSIATFASMRGYEFWRNGPVLHELPVCLVGVDGGLDYGYNGPTHHALEDVALMRAQPGHSVVAHADSQQTGRAVRAIAELDGPAYLRLGKAGEAVPGLEGRFRLGRCELIGDGEDLVIVTYGAVARHAVAAAELLAQEGIDATVAIAACLAPPPLDDLAEVLERVPLALTLEGHYSTGGVGSLVAEVVAERGLECRVERRGVEHLPSGQGGSAEWLEERHGLTAPRVAEAAAKAFQLER